MQNQGEARKRIVGIALAGGVGAMATVNDAIQFGENVATYGQPVLTAGIAAAVVAEDAMIAFARTCDEARPKSGQLPLSSGPFESHTTTTTTSTYATTSTTPEPGPHVV